MIAKIGSVRSITASIRRAITQEAVDGGSEACERTRARGVGRSLLNPCCINIMQKWGAAATADPLARRNHVANGYITQKIDVKRDRDMKQEYANQVLPRASLAAARCTRLQFAQIAAAKCSTCDIAAGINFMEDTGRCLISS